ncbi:hypothetical protein GCM10027269_59130 [Kribbella endophytica]
MSDRDWPYWVIRIVCVVTFVAGSTLIVGGLPGISSWPESFVPAGTAMIVASLAAIVGVHATVSWRHLRRRELEVSEHRHREEVYEELIKHMTDVFDPTSPKRPETPIRAQVALWGSPETIRALKGWHVQTHLIMSQYGGFSPADRMPNKRSGIGTRRWHSRFVRS